MADELKASNYAEIKYRCYLLPDGKTFMHFDQFETEEAHQFLQSLESFKKFSEELWATGLLINQNWIYYL